MTSELSILIPVFNAECYGLVEDLRRQCNAVESLSFEIIVLDDCSDNFEATANERINSLPGCRFARNDCNLGRAGNRNKLASMAHFKWLLFIDGDMTIDSQDFILRYLGVASGLGIVYGGYKIGGMHPDNLRWCYEKKYLRSLHKMEKERFQVYNQFRTCNFLINREVFSQLKFDTSLKLYGYEDTCFARKAHALGYEIRLTDNPVVFADFEPNHAFLAKTEAALRNLKMLEADLAGSSLLLNAVRFLHLLRLTAVFRRFYRSRRAGWRKTLVESKPNLRIFYLYKLGYYLDLPT